MTLYDLVPTSFTTIALNFLVLPLYAVLVVLIGRMLRIFPQADLGPYTTYYTEDEQAKFNRALRNPRGRIEILPNHYLKENIQRAIEAAKDSSWKDNNCFLLVRYVSVRHYQMHKNRVDRETAELDKHGIRCGLCLGDAILLPGKADNPNYYDNLPKSRIRITRRHSE